MEPEKPLLQLPVSNTVRSGSFFMRMFCWGGLILMILVMIYSMYAPVSGGVDHRVARARTETQHIGVAVFLFHVDYAYYPVPQAHQVMEEDLVHFTGMESSRMFQVLAGIPENFNVDHQLNPLQKVYLFSENLGEDGSFSDPWGTQYRILLDRNQDGQIQFPADGPVYRTQVLVVSAGPDGKFSGGEGNVHVADNVVNILDG